MRNQPSARGGSRTTGPIDWTLLPTSNETTWDRAVLFLAMGAAIAVMVSNAVSQILLGAAAAALLLSRRRWQFPVRLWLPLALFVTATLVSLALSPDPRAGLPQVKKFYVYLMLPVLYTALSNVTQVRTILLSQAAVAGGSSVWAFLQFIRKRGEAAALHEEFYAHYVARRVTGFMGHWMTFSAEEMIAGLALGALLLFGAVREKRVLWAGVLVLIGAGIGLGWTRSVWLGTGAGLIYLVSARRPLALLAAPVAALLLWFAAPAPMQERVLSLYKPHGNTDSNEHRRITFVTGLEMVKAHPWFGLGPEMPGRQFERYVPASVSRPLPEAFYGHLHNVYLQIAAERGLLALAAFLWLIGTILKDVVGAAFRQRTPSANPTVRAVLHGVAAAMAAILVEALFEHNLGDSEILTLFFVLIACAYACLRLSQDNKTYA